MMARNLLLSLISIIILAGSVSAYIIEDFESTTGFSGMSSSTLSSSVTGATSGTYSLKVAVASCTECTPGASSTFDYNIYPNNPINITFYTPTGADCPKFVIELDDIDSKKCVYTESTISNGQNTFTWNAGDYDVGESSNCNTFNWEEITNQWYYCSIGESGPGAFDFYLDQFGAGNAVIPAQITLEDFEDVSDWTFTHDIGAFAVDNGKKVEGTYSGKITIDDNTDGDGELNRVLGTAIDLSSYDRVNLSLWLDTNDWITETYVFSLGLVDSSSNLCQTAALPTTNFADEAWTDISFNISGSGYWEEYGCDWSDIKRYYILFYTDTITPTIYVWLDNLFAYSTKYITPPPDDTCTPPASGDWEIKHNCTLDAAKTITGDLNITAHSSLNISGTLTVSGKDIRIETGGWLAIESGGQING